jgi:PAS domain S-box-containing protein
MGYKLQDLLDIKLFQELQDKLNAICPFPSAILDNEGNILTATAWQDVCTRFHRVHPDAEKECRLSDQHILSHLHEANPAVSYRCPHGLVDNAVPIVIGGQHLANFFTGQFFLEPPDLEFFRQQARRYGFDEKAYLEAVARVPIWSQTQLDQYLAFVKMFTEALAEMGMTRLQEAGSKERIRQSEKKYRCYIDNAPVGVFIADTEGRYREVNPCACAMTGFTEEELLRMRVQDLVPAEGTELARRHFDGVQEQGRASGLIPFQRKDGTTGWWTVDAVKLSDDRLMGITTEVTEHRRVMQELRYERDRFARISEASPVGIVQADAQGQLSYANLRAEQILGLKTEEICSRSYHAPEWRITALDGGPFPEEKLPFVRVQREAGPVFDVQHAIVWPEDGRRTDLSINAAPISGEDGVFQGMVATIEDITERRRTETALQASERRFGALFENMSEGVALHEILNDPSGVPVDYRVIEVNPAFFSQVGISREAARGQLATALYQANPPPFLDAYARVASTGQPLRFERYFAPLGRHFEISVASPGKGLFATIFTDITNRKRAEEQIRALALRHEALLAAVPEIVACQAI